MMTISPPMQNPHRHWPDGAIIWWLSILLILISACGDNPFDEWVEGPTEDRVIEHSQEILRSRISVLHGSYYLTDSEPPIVDSNGLSIDRPADEPILWPLDSNLRVTASYRSLDDDVPSDTYSYWGYRFSDTGPIWISQQSTGQGSFFKEQTFWFEQRGDICEGVARQCVELPFEFFAVDLTEEYAWYYDGALDSAVSVARRAPPMSVLIPCGPCNDDELTTNSDNEEVGP